MIKTSVQHSRKALLPVALALAACLVLAGCAGSSSQGAASASSTSASSDSASSLSAQAADKELVFGEKTATAISIVFTNETGADITALSAVPASGEGAAVQLMKSGEKWPAGKVATVYVEPVAGGIYNMPFTSGGAEWQIHNIDFNRFDAMSILVADGIAYINTVIDGNPVSSHNEEYDIANPPVEQSAPSPEEPVATYEEPVATYEEPAAANAQPEAAGNNADAAGGNTEAQAPAQSEDRCVSDVVLN